MTAPDARRRPSGTGRLGIRCDGYPRRSVDRVLSEDSRRVCPCEVCSPPRRAAWVLRPDLRPATFEELVAAGILTNEDLAIPVEVVA